MMTTNLYKFLTVFVVLKQPIRPFVFYYCDSFCNCNNTQQHFILQHTTARSAGLGLCCLLFV